MPSEEVGHDFAGRRLTEHAEQFWLVLTHRIE